MKSGFIAVVGRPNVGKSTVVNKMVSEKVAIVSDKSGTTRENIKGILNFNGNQYIFIDTPGIHKPRHLLGEFMTNKAIGVLKEVDVILFLLDGTQEISTGDLFVYERILDARNTPRILVLNKIDKLSNKELENKRIEIEEKFGKFDGYVEIAGEYGIGVHKLVDEITKYLQDDIMYYPEDMYTDMPTYRIITEIVREKILIKTRDEIPHSVAIEILNVKNNKTGKDKFDINIYVEKKSQKGIIIGKYGSLLKEIGIEARKDIEELLGKDIYLNLWVKVKDDWRKKKPFLRELGYVLEEE